MMTRKEWPVRKAPSPRTEVAQSALGEKLDDGLIRRILIMVERHLGRGHTPQNPYWTTNTIAPANFPHIICRLAEP
jgi:hypothetical protein